VAPGVGLALGATPPAVAPAVGVVLVPQLASPANVTSATMTVIVRSTAWRVGDMDALVMMCRPLFDGDSALPRGSSSRSIRS
jgi:hypothetical protein